MPIEPLSLAVPDARPAMCSGSEDCRLPNAQSECVGGECAIAACEPGRADGDGDPLNGCEACAARPGPDDCDGVDSDCDGLIDEDGDGTIDACGACDVSCTGAEAIYACRADRCVVESCSPGRYGLGGPGEGCRCAVADVRPRAVEVLRPLRPRGLRMAFPGDGRPGAALWTAVEDGAHRLWRWAVTPDGYPIGAPQEVSELPGPAAVLDAWYGPDGALVAVVDEPVGDDRQRLTVWRDAVSDVLRDDCSTESCRVVRLPEQGAGLVRRTRSDDAIAVVRPDGEPIESWSRPMDGPLPDVDLVDAACLDPSRCLVVVRRGGLRLIGLIDAPLEDVDEVDLVGGGLIGLAVRIDDRVVVSATDGDRVIGPVELPPRGWRAPRLLLEPDGGAWLVATEDGRPVALELDAQLQPLGEGRSVAAGFEPAGLAGPGLFFDHRPQVGTVQRRLWVDFPDGTPIGGGPVRAFAGQLLYRTATGVFAAPEDAVEPVEPRLLMRRLEGPAGALAGAVVEGRAWAVEPGSVGLVAFALDGEERRSIAVLIDGEPHGPGPWAAVALDAAGRMAVVDRLADGRAFLGWGHLDEPTVTLQPTGRAPEDDLRLIGAGERRWLVSRLEPGVGYETLIRRLGGDGPGDPARFARRFHPDAAVAASTDGLLLAWLDRRSERCGDGADTVRVARLADAATPTVGELSLAACPRGVALNAIDGRVVALVQTDEGLSVHPLASDGASSAPAVEIVGAQPGPVTLAADADTAVWSADAALYVLPLDCGDADDEAP